MRNYLFLFLLCFGTLAAHAQADIFGAEQTPKKKGFVIGVNADLDVPMADMAKRYGTSYRIGPSLMYKTTSNWMFGVKCDWIFGNKMKEDSLMWNIRGTDGSFITNSGDRQNVGLFERGYVIGVEVGKIIPFIKNVTNSGLTLKMGLGFVQHKINIYDKDKEIAQVQGDYRKGYDRLTNGIYVEPYIGYTNFDKKGYFNFHIGVDMMTGFTQSRRDYQYDLMRKDDKNRVDILFGLRGGWYIPIFRKKSEDIYFDN